MNTQKLLPEGKSIITKGEITSLNLKTYLNIKEDKFTISNDVLYINHNKGNELVLNLKTKERWNNPVILNNEIPLCSVFNIPVTTPDHTFTLNHNDIDIYTETVEPESMSFTFMWNFSGLKVDNEKPKYKLRFKSHPTEKKNKAWTVELPNPNPFVKSQAFDNEYSIKLNRHRRPYGDVKRHYSYSHMGLMSMDLIGVQPLEYQPRAQLHYLDYQYPNPIPNFDQLTERYIGRPNTPQTRQEIANEITETGRDYLRRLRERIIDDRIDGEVFPIFTARQRPRETEEETNIDRNGRDWSQVGGRGSRTITLRKTNTDGIRFMVDWDETKPVTPEPKEEPELSESQENLRRVIREYLNKPHEPEFIWDHKPIQSDRATALSMSIRAAQIPHENNLNT